MPNSPPGRSCSGERLAESDPPVWRQVVEAPGVIHEVEAVNVEPVSEEVKLEERHRLIVAGDAVSGGL